MTRQDNFYVIVDGIAWEDSDGRYYWPRVEADGIAESCERMGYTSVEVEAAFK